MSCPACGGSRIESLLCVADMPVLVGALWPSQELARRARTGRIDLAACDDCAHVFNAGFDPALVEYDGGYDNSLHFSPTFQAYANRLARRLVDSYDLRGKTVLEIGCGKGEFLRTLCKRGGNVGIGYDPSYGGESDDDKMRFVNGLYPLDGDGDGFDFLVCRHVLEHLEQPHDLLEGLRRSCVGPSVRAYLEVPNGQHTLTPSGQWDLIYPHVSYFTPDSLRRLVERSGFEVLRAGTAFDGQFLYVEAAVGPPVAARRSNGARRRRALTGARRFASTYPATVTRWQERLAGTSGEDGAALGGTRTALWGVGARGTTFLNTVGRDSRVRVVVDINPRKWGRFVPGTGHRVCPPEILPEVGVDTVVIVNDAYRREIAESLRGLGVSADIVSV